MDFRIHPFPDVRLVFQVRPSDVPGFQCPGRQIRDGRLVESHHIFVRYHQEGLQQHGNLGLRVNRQIVEDDSIVRLHVCRSRLIGGKALVDILPAVCVIVSPVSVHAVIAQDIHGDDLAQRGHVRLRPLIGQAGG